MDFANWMANVPTPPDAPLIKTLCPASTWPARRQTRAVLAARGMAAACSKLRPAGILATTPLRGGDILRDRRIGLTEDVVARPPQGDAFAHRLHCAGEVGTANPDPRPGAAERRRIEQASKLGLSPHDVPVPRIDRCCPDADQYFLVAGHGRGDVIDPEDIGRAVAVLDERSHIPSGCRQPSPTGHKHSDDDCRLVRRGDDESVSGTRGGRATTARRTSWSLSSTAISELRSGVWGRSPCLQRPPRRLAEEASSCGSSLS